MNHADRTRAVKAIMSQLAHLLGPAGLDMLAADLQLRPAPRDNKARTHAPSDGGVGHADPTPTQAVDPTHAGQVWGKVDIRLELMLEQADELVDIHRKEHQRVTMKDPAPKQLDPRFCVDCIRGKTAGGKPLEVPIDRDGDYKDRCKFCGRWRKEHSHRIPVGICEYRDRYGESRLTTKVIAAAYRDEGRTIPLEFLPVSSAS